MCDDGPYLIRFRTVPFHAYPRTIPISSSTSESTRFIRLLPSPTSEVSAPSVQKCKDRTIQTHLYQIRIGPAASLQKPKKTPEPPAGRSPRHDKHQSPWSAQTRAPTSSAHSSFTVCLCRRDARHASKRRLSKTQVFPEDLWGRFQIRTRRRDADLGVALFEVLMPVRVP